jgi:adenine-specific DNA-methyltransferase
MLDILRINSSLNRTYARLPLSRAQIDLFKTEWREIFAKIDPTQDEEYHKNLIAKGLQTVFYHDYLVNVNKRQDLVIREGKRPTDAVGVILEFKKPDNRSEMISEAKPNAKALHELILYYLRETLDHNNHTIKHLVATNIWEWYIFDGVWFEKNIFRNAKLRKDYEAWKISGHDTHYFYTQIAKPFLDNLDEKTPCTFFNLLDYQAIIQNDDEADDEKLIELYKILSPEHLLKKPFANDSNTLNREFYEELLHILGLTEVKEGGKKVLVRLPENARHEGSLLENVISKLPGGKKLAVIPNLHEFGESLDNQLFSVALELCITWLNRILFLKLLEGQIVRYHRGSRDFAFLNLDKIRDFDELDELFFEVLAVKVGERSASVSQKYGKIPYLNSSLFEPTQLELQIFTIGCLKDRLSLPLFAHTVLKDAQGTRRSGERSTLQYTYLSFWMPTILGQKAGKKSKPKAKPSSMRRCWA